MEFESAKDFSNAMLQSAELVPFDNEGAVQRIDRSVPQEGYSPQDEGDDGLPVAIPNDKVMSSDRFYGGEKAVKKLEEVAGRPLTTVERRIAQLEGYFDGVYEDSKGVRTAGLGQTGEFINMSPTAVIELKERATRRAIADYDSLPEEVKAELVQLTYRGDLSPSNKWVALFNKAEYEEAAKELLNHKGYMSPDTKRGIKDRLKQASKVISALA